MEPQL